MERRDMFTAPYLTTALVLAVLVQTNRTGSIHILADAYSMIFTYFALNLELVVDLLIRYTATTSFLTRAGTIISMICASISFCSWYPWDSIQSYVSKFYFTSLLVIAASNSFGPRFLKRSCVLILAIRRTLNPQMFQPSRLSRTTISRQQTHQGKLSFRVNISMFSETN
ncbi:hypothetical protein Hypma_008332 [Hypsizygus marmoreus]|uniref:Uncharacterized protein n=1 Tax=Hypsizygus marmoreus TaxID=39966 RepID=A0A369K0N5_HYPMA|nr:hypothetical protein Hypma_008332 [Hypsizygus marmoreus]